MAVPLIERIADLELCSLRRLVRLDGRELLDGVLHVFEASSDEVGRFKLA
jgi:hypothetical protein